MRGGEAVLRHLLADEPAEAGAGKTGRLVQFAGSGPSSGPVSGSD